MTDKQRLSSLNPNGLKDTRPTLGLFITSLNEPWTIPQWLGVLEAAHEYDVNLICFLGDQLNIPDGFNSQANIIYDLVDIHRVNGLILWAGGLANHIDQKGLQAFCQRYQPMPIVSAEVAIEGIPGVFLDDYQAMREAITHLIEVHHYHRIAFSLGSPGHLGHQTRYRAYVDTLQDYGLPVDPKLVFDYHWFYDKDRVSWVLQQEEPIEVIVAPEDNNILEVFHSLRARGAHIPRDIALVGFDDLEESRMITPPLTTVHSPFYEMGRKAVEMLLALIAGEQTPERVVMPSQLMVRQSCGCKDPAIIQAGVNPAVETPAREGLLEFTNLEAMLATRSEDILAEIRPMIMEGHLNLETGQVMKLLKAFIAEVEQKPEAGFLLALDELVEQAAIAGEIVGWQQLLSVFRRELQPYLHRPDTVLHVENLWQQARVLIGKAAERVQGYRQVQIDQQMTILSRVGSTLISMLDVENLMETLTRELPRLNIPSAYLAMYEDPQQPTGLARLMMAYNDQGEIDIKAREQIFLAPQLLPADLWPVNRKFSLALLPLYFRDQQFGFALLEIGPKQGNVYGTLREQISSSLRSALLIQEQEQTQKIISRRVVELELVAQISAASTFLDVTELLQRVSDLTKASFGLYHAHIYLLNEAGDTLLLAAGAGDVGRQMTAKKWQIPLSQERSLVARAARTRRGDIVNDTRSDPAWLPNSLLPETRSELAVPLIAGERVIGVLDVQANTPHYFRNDDIRIQSTLAAQVAVALENARLFEETQSTLAETATLYQFSRRIIETNDLQVLMAVIAEVGDVTDINTVVLGFLERDADGKLIALYVEANWHSGEGAPPPANHTRLLAAKLPYFGLLVGAEQIFIDDVLHDDRVDLEMLTAMQGLHIQSLAILPLWVSTRQVGVLLLQAQRVHAFAKRERRLYASLAGQVAVFVENQRLLAESRAISAELETTQRRYTIQAWETYRARHTALSYEYQRDNLSPAEDNAQVEMAAQENGGDPAKSTANLVVPLAVRGEVIGVLGLQEPASTRPWLPAERTLVEAIAQQVAQAAENLRLIDETQQRAARERRAAEIGDKIRGTQSLEEALQVAVKELGLSLKAPQTAVRLQISNEV